VAREKSRSFSMPFRDGAAEGEVRAQIIELAMAHRL